MALLKEVRFRIFHGPYQMICTTSELVILTLIHRRNDFVAFNALEQKITFLLTKFDANNFPV